MDISRKEKLRQLLGINQKKEKILEIQKEMFAPSFWTDSKKAAAKNKEFSDLQKEIAEFESVESPQELEKLELKSVLSGEHDTANAILSIHAGTGGIEAQDWAEMLLRMYQRYADKHRFKVEILDESRGEEAGIKSTTLRIEGSYAFGFLKTEAGVHRLVRISPFDADRARHTSFALVEVIPEIETTEEVEINPKDLKIDTFRSSGRGGQNVNKVETAVRITHLPSKIVVSVQTQRSQGQNRQLALKILQARLYQLRLKEKKAEERKLRGEYLSAQWGNQIRSYVLHPYQMVKDHRTGYETTDTQAVLDGEIEPFVEAYLKSKK